MASCALEGCGMVVVTRLDGAAPDGDGVDGVFWSALVGWCSSVFVAPVAISQRLYCKTRSSAAKNTDSIGSSEAARDRSWRSYRLSVLPPLCM